MGYEAIPAGKDIPNDFNVIIEIPAQSDPVKYEVDKDTQTLWVDRFIGTGTSTCASDTATGLCLLNISVRVGKAKSTPRVANARISPRLTAC